MNEIFDKLTQAFPTWRLEAKSEGSSFIINCALKEPRCVIDVTSSDGRFHEMYGLYLYDFHNGYANSQVAFSKDGTILQFRLLLIRYARSGITKTEDKRALLRSLR